MEEVLIPLKDVTSKATIPQMKYWAKLLGIGLVVRGRVAHVTGPDSQKLAQVAELVRDGKSPQDAVQMVGPTSTALVRPPEDGTKQVDWAKKIGRLEERNEGVERALLAVVEELRALRKENSVLNGYLMPPQMPAAQVIPWQPNSPKDPLEGMGWLQKAYVKVVEPWRMRRYDS